MPENVVFTYCKIMVFMVSYFMLILVPRMCDHGGIGRRASLRGWWEQSRGGSNPLGRTITLEVVVKIILFNI